MTQRRKTGDDRRAEIRRVALELFTVRGYEATSMREIAERLDITKAALYYHFDSKESIVRSLFEERLATLDALIEWAEAQPPSADRTARIAAGWFSLVVEGGLGFARFALANQAALRDLMPHKGGAGGLDRMQKVSALMADPGTPPLELLKIRMALMSANLAVMGSHDLNLTDEEIIRAAAETASLLAPGLASAIMPG
ncbi:helix-turn-helix domain-containing protein [Umezawaea sp. Da 62-37]|uniref:TetR/AcrR family transcriptional regulator n=1 Tax=Umezawaea sp. Da 62-37 TaxID=3075927 RepID=UPI0028F6F535|nr:helix-turn-helix domain-containing protein [Umezawaea sp. Da 62-37]WNV91069.1 helix-turn-helix domain-containing protein [Umezawaea sp. Da 62-37]